MVEIVLGAKPAVQLFIDMNRDGCDVLTICESNKEVQKKFEDYLAVVDEKRLVARSRELGASSRRGRSFNGRSIGGRSVNRNASIGSHGSSTWRANRSSNRHRDSKQNQASGSHILPSFDNKSSPKESSNYKTRGFREKDNVSTITGRETLDKLNEPAIGYGK